MATTNISAISSSFTLASEGACLIDMMESGTIKLWVGAALPVPNIGAYYVIGYNEGGFSYSGTENVYIISNDGASHLCVSTGVV